MPSARIPDHIHELRRYAILLCRNADEADDLVQATLERALARADTFRPDGDLRVWLFAILHNSFASGRRTRRRRLAVLAACLPAELSWWGARAPATPQQEARQELRSVLSLLDRLPEVQRHVLLLVAIDGLGTDEIATILDLPVGTVRSRLARGREALRKLSAGASPLPDLKVVGGRDG